MAYIVTHIVGKQLQLSPYEIRVVNTLANHNHSHNIRNMHDLQALSELRKNGWLTGKEIRDGSPHLQREAVPTLMNRLASKQIVEMREVPYDGSRGRRHKGKKPTLKHYRLSRDETPYKSLLVWAINENIHAQWMNTDYYLTNAYRIILSDQFLNALKIPSPVMQGNELQYLYESNGSNFSTIEEFRAFTINNLSRIELEYPHNMRTEGEPYMLVLPKLLLAHLELPASAFETERRAMIKELLPIVGGGIHPPKDEVLVWNFLAAIGALQLYDRDLSGVQRSVYRRQFALNLNQIYTTIFQSRLFELLDNKESRDHLLRIINTYKEKNKKEEALPRTAKDRK